MFKNYIKITFRNLIKNKAFSFINIVGLSIGIAACLLIAQYVSFELSYDQFHKHAHDTYRIYLDIYKNGSRKIQSARVAPAVATAFQRDFSAIDTYTRLVILGPDGVLTYKDNYISESNIVLADSVFFDVFSFNLLFGDKRTAFSEPFGIVITKQTANKLFGEEYPLGKSIVINAKNFGGTSPPFKVTGVLENFPENTHVQPGVLISYPTLYEFVGHRFDNSWVWNNTYTYFRLYSDADPEVLEADFPAVVNRHNQDYLEKQNLDWKFKLQPVTDIHLYSDLQHEISTNGNAFYVWLLAGIGLLILVMAYINFVNLVTVKALQRAKEVGIRKTSGANRGQLIFQFSLEALIINGIALFLAFTLIELCRSNFSNLFDVKLVFIANSSPGIWVGFAGFVLLLVIGSAFYPALKLSQYHPAKVLKGNIIKGSTGNALRKFLVTTQFTIALMVIVLTIIVTQQVRFMQQQSLGFNPEQVIVLKAPKAYDYGYGNNFSRFQNAVRELAQVKSVTGANVMPGQEIYWYDDQVTINGEETSGVFSIAVVAANYFSQFNIPFIAGRSFNESLAEQERWIINEKAVRLLGFEDAEDALGQRLNMGEIIGVVKDFHHQSLKAAIAPMLFNCGEVFNFYSIKVGTAQLENVMTEIKTTFEEVFPGSPYEYFFLDKFFNRQYEAEQNFNTLFSLFSGLAIFIACLGLLGLSSYEATLRTKEIGIRKVLGSSVFGIVYLLSSDFTKMVFAAIVIALPISYLAAQNWLNDFAYRIDLEAWYFISAGLVTLLIAWLTVGMQALKAANVNPVQYLRDE